jgi:tetratricopeptide (TPR) repeat protein
MEKSRTTSLRIVLTAFASFALQTVTVQGQPAIPKPLADHAAPTAASTSDTPRNWLPALTVDESKNEFAAGLRALRARQWAKAALHFELALQGSAYPREAQKRLAQALKSLGRLTPSQRLAGYYSEGTTAMARNEWRRALLALRKAGELEPGYRDTDLLLQRTNQALRQQLFTAHLPAVSTLLVDSLHAAALQAMARADWLAAIVALEKIQVLKPTYSNAEALLLRAYQGLQTASKPESREQSVFRFDLNVVTLAAGLVLLPLLGYWIVSPSLRARVHFARGNFSKAVQIYEKLIARNPRRVRHYDKLAQACWYLGRRDEFALRIYQIVLQLNLLNRALRSEINDVVAQYYLAEGRHDRDAIPVLEEALAHELHKHQNGSLALIKGLPNGVATKTHFGSATS